MAYEIIIPEPHIINQNITNNIINDIVNHLCECGSFYHCYGERDRIPRKVVINLVQQIAEAFQSKGYKVDYYEYSESNRSDYINLSIEVK